MGGGMKKIALSTMLLLGACAGHAPRTAAPRAVEPVVAEAWMSAARLADNIDSVAVWHAPDGAVRVYASAKKTDRVVVFDAADGREIGSIGASGAAPGQLSRPNGVAIVDDRLYVVERDNRRVQAFALPGGEPIGHFGGGDLVKPYGVWIDARGERLRVYVTDNYETAAETTPPPAELGRRVRVYDVARRNAFDAKLVQSFGATSGDAILRVVESIAGDPAYDHLLIADEELAGGSFTQLYTLRGEPAQRKLGVEAYRHQAEGLALYACDDGDGVWIASDQDPREQRFLAFDRRTLAFRGAFKPAKTRTTDGIAIDRRASARFPAGALYAQHDNRAVAAFDWRDVARALGVRDDCVAAARERL
jgi:3-phytase